MSLNLPIPALKSLLRPTYDPFDVVPELYEDIITHHSEALYAKGKFQGWYYDFARREHEGAVQERHTKFVSMLRLRRIPPIMVERANEAIGLTDLHRDFLSSVRQLGWHIVTFVANDPVRHGVIWCIGIQEYGSSQAECASKVAEHQEILYSLLRGVYRQIVLEPLTIDEASWVTERLRTWREVAVLRGLPEPRREASLSVATPLAGVSPESTMEEQVEVFCRAMINREYLLMMLDSPLSEESILRLLAKTAKRHEEVKTDVEVVRANSAGISLPFMGMGNLGGAQAIGHSVGSSLSHTQGVSQSLAHSQTDGQSASFSQGHSETQSQSIGQNLGQSASLSHSQGISQSHSQGISQSHGVTASESQGQSISHGETESQSQGVSQSHGVTESISHGETNTRGQSESHSSSASLSQSLGRSSSDTGSQNFSNSLSSGGSKSTTGSLSLSTGQGSSKGASADLGIGVNTSASSKGGDTLGSTHGVTNSTSDTQGLSFGASQSKGESYSAGATASQGSSQGFSQSQALSQSESLGHSSSIGTSDSISHGITDTAGASAGLSQGQSASAGLSQGQSAGASAGAGMTRGLSSGETASQSSSQASNVSSSQGVSQSQGVTQSQGQSLGEGTSQTQGGSDALSSAWGWSGSLGIAPVISTTMSKVEYDEQKRVLSQIYATNQSRMVLARQEGAVEGHMYLLAPDSPTLEAGTGAAIESFWGLPKKGDLPTRFHALSGLTPEEREHMLEHVRTFSGCRVEEPSIEALEEHAYSTIWTTTEMAVLAHPPRVDLPGIQASLELIPAFRLPIFRDGDIHLGHLISSQDGLVSRHKYGLTTSEVSDHILIAGMTRAGKTVTATRLISGWVNQPPIKVSRVENGKIIREKRHFGAVVIDWKNDHRGLINHTDKSRFRFISLANPEFGFKYNMLQVPDGVSAEMWMNTTAEVFSLAFGLGQRGKGIIRTGIWNLYTKDMPLKWIDENADEKRTGNVLSHPELSRYVGMLDLAREVEAMVQAANANRNTPSTQREGLNIVALRLSYFTSGSELSKIYTRDITPAEESNPQYMALLSAGELAHKCYTLTEILEGDNLVVMEGGGLDSIVKKAIISEIAAGIITYAKAKGRDCFTPPKMLVLEEAHEVLVGGDTNGAEVAGVQETTWEIAWNEGAGYGIRMVAIVQMPDAVPAAILANSGILIIHQVGVEDAQAQLITKIGKDWKTDHRQYRRFLGTLPRGWAVVKPPNTADYGAIDPVLIKVDMLGTEIPDDVAIKRHLSLFPVGV